MCIVLLTTAHPSYALIVCDNRDEFILRPTSRPHWWSALDHQILSSRDLQRAEQGTWLGITNKGNFSVLTNYNETDTHDELHPVQGQRSRGSMVTAWLTSPDEESVQQFVYRLLEREGVKGVGGFTVICGKLRKRNEGNQPQIEPLAVISNRYGTAKDVPWVAGERDEIYGLSNTSYDDPDVWPKVKIGKERLLEAVNENVKLGLGKDDLIEKLFGVLDTNTLPDARGRDFEEMIPELRNSVFIPTLGTPLPSKQTCENNTAAKLTNGVKETKSGDSKIRGASETELTAEERPEMQSNSNGVMSGQYGTQRQTVILVDWDGHVTYTERSLFDPEGVPIERTKGDMQFEFEIEEWHGTDNSTASLEGKQ
ncbi:NRDE protein-domain-containing protein [Xylogone sp. PMI_703]|nr:NRDE protein-domain-containing protein [Xylogone sp. PMI_703]